MEIECGIWTMSTPLCTAWQSFFRCSYQVVSSLPGRYKNKSSKQRDREKFVGMWRKKSLWDESQGDKGPRMELSSKYGVGSLLKWYYTQNISISLCTQLDLTLRSNLTLAAMHHLGWLLIDSCKQAALLVKKREQTTKRAKWGDISSINPILRHTFQKRDIKMAPLCTAPHRVAL